MKLLTLVWALSASYAVTMAVPAIELGNANNTFTGTEIQNMNKSVAIPPPWFAPLVWAVGFVSSGLSSYVGKRFEVEKLPKCGVSFYPFSSSSSSSSSTYSSSICACMLNLLFSCQK
jgi:tryptophan-rich sensory protein